MKNILQQPSWPDAAALHDAGRRVAALAPLVSIGEIQGLAESLAAVASGRAFLLQGGDCAESFQDRPADVRRRWGLLDETARALESISGLPVVRVGRLAGQYAKPRSAPMEVAGDALVPSFRGHIVHEETPTPVGRAPDPVRLVWAYHRAASVLDLLRHGTDAVAAAALPYPADPPDQPSRRPVDGKRALTTRWTAHEALLLDYEEALTRWDAQQGVWYDSSAHFLWVGERTRQVDGAHVEFLSGISNPVGCKLGPAATPEQVLEICGRLDPYRQPGRLTLITRLGAANAADRLPALVRTVHDAGHPVIWVCDPMHGNIVTDASGRKLRRLRDIIAETAAFFDVHERLGTWAGGLHLEMTAEDVVECTDDSPDAGRTPTASYRSLCDPRLNKHQALHVVREIAPKLPRQILGSPRTGARQAGGLGDPTPAERGWRTSAGADGQERGHGQTLPPFYGDVARLLSRPVDGSLRLATLGPTGTSSEEAARHLLDGLARFGTGSTAGEVTLHRSFEEAAETVIAGVASAVIVANAYDGANHLYMDDRLELAGAFVRVTPPYGMAAHRAHPMPLSVRVATHPAPLPLLSGLLPPALRLSEVIPAQSTRDAARLVDERKADLALTNATSAREQGLRFVSFTRPIVMLWSVFIRNGSMP